MLHLVVKHIGPTIEYLNLTGSGSVRERKREGEREGRGVERERERGRRRDDYDKPNDLHTETKFNVFDTTREDKLSTEQASMQAFL